MKVGDLVVRIWCKKPVWSQVGLIIEKKDISGYRWLYAIKWNVQNPLSTLGDMAVKWDESEFKVIDLLKKNEGVEKREKNEVEKCTA